MQSTSGLTDRKGYIVTGPTSGIGRATVLELAKQATVILLGRDRQKLGEMQKLIQQQGGDALAVPCDLSDLASVRRAAAEIVSLHIPLAGLVNNAGIMQMCPTKSAQGWDSSYATNHLGPFVLTEALLPHLLDGANVVFVASGVEDPDRKPAKMAGFRGGRYISAAASARGEWIPGGSKLPGGDAYATTKQCALATALEFARETPRLHINAVEPGFSPATSLGRDASPFLRFLSRNVLSLLAPHIKYWSTPERAGRVIAEVLRNKNNKTGMYYDEKGHPCKPPPRCATPGSPRASSRKHDPCWPPLPGRHAPPPFQRPPAACSRGDRCGCSASSEASPTLAARAMRSSRGTPAPSRALADSPDITLTT